MKYRAVFEREPDGRWTVEVPEIRGCHTYGRTIDQARNRLREALSLFVDDAEKAEFQEDIKLPNNVSQIVRDAKQRREALSREEAKMLTAQMKAVKQLRDLKLGYRDTGALLGLSHQRVQQLEHRRARVDSAIVEQGSRPARGGHRGRMASKKR